MTNSIMPNPVTRGLLILYSSTLLSGFGWAMIFPVIPLLVTYYDVSVGAAAQTITAFGIGRFVGMPISGVMLDQLGTRSAVVIGPIATCFAALLAAVAPWFSIILISVFIIGVADSIWRMGREVAGIDLTHLEQRGRVLSGFHGVHHTGQAIGPLLGGLLAEAVGFRAVFIIFAICAAGSIFLGLISHDTRTCRASKLGLDPLPIKGWSIEAVHRRIERLAGIYRQIQPHLRTTYLVLVFATLTSITFRITLLSIFPLYAGSHLGFTPTEVGLLFSISGLFSFAMILPAGFVLDKMGRKWATVPSTAIPALVFFFMPFSHTFFQLAVLVSLAGIANGLSLGSLATSTYDVIPSNSRGRLQAVRRMVAEIGGVGGPLGGGLLANLYNPGAPFLAYAPFLALTPILLSVVARETLVK